MSHATDEIAAAAARLVVEDGLEYGAAKRRAARDVARHGGRSNRSIDLPSNEQIEDEVRAHIELFFADEQPAELRALRELALAWMRRLADFRPHLAGAAWRGTATRRSALHLELYCDDPKTAEIALINAGVRYDVEDTGGSARPGRGEPLVVLTVGAPCPALGETVTLHLALHDHDDLRGALKPDPRGRTWRGDLAALERLLVSEAA